MSNLSIYLFPARLRLFGLLGLRWRRRRGPGRRHLGRRLLLDAVQREAPLLQLDHGPTVVLHLKGPRSHGVLVPVEDLRRLLILSNRPTSNEGIYRQTGKSRMGVAKYQSPKVGGRLTSSLNPSFYIPNALSASHPNHTTGCPSRTLVGLVDFDFGNSAVCPILPGLMRDRQSSWAR